MVCKISTDLLNKFHAKYVSLSCIYNFPIYRTTSRYLVNFNELPILAFLCKEELRGANSFASFLVVLNNKTIFQSPHLYFRQK